MGMSSPCRRAASIAYFTLFSMAPTLLVVIAVAGLTFGQEAARGAIVSELGGLMGRETAEATDDRASPGPGTTWIRTRTISRRWSKNWTSAK